jgi:8-oxo-dGTP pyrophosphatase MutT (NUDIX family)
MEQTKAFEVKNSSSVLLKSARANPLFDVVAHNVTFPLTNHPGARFYTIEYKFFACSAVCINPEGKVLLVHVPRFPTRNIPGDEYSWELPGGRSQGNESPIECIKRELFEEAGIVVLSLEPLLKDYFYPECSFGTEKLYLFKSVNFRIRDEKVPEQEGVLSLKWFDFSDTINMIWRGEIRSSWTIIGLLATKLSQGGG